jgi:electron transfer flavoprotein beta subunit
VVIVVCLKHVISSESTLRVSATKTWVNEEDVAWVMSESDGFALEEALRLRESHGGDVVVVSYGPARVSTMLRDALARGADRAIHVADETTAPCVDPFVVASALAHSLAGERPDLVFTGLQSDDLGFAQVGVLLAETLQMAHATLATAIDVSDEWVRVKCELEGGWMQWLSVPRPAVITVQSGGHPLRFATMRGIMGAKKKEIRTVHAPAAVEPRQRILSVSTPQRRRTTQFLEGDSHAAATELAVLLHRDRIGGALPSLKH